MTSKLGERHGADLFPEPSEGVWLCQYLDFGLLACHRVRAKPLLVKPPFLWYFVMGALGINTNDIWPVFLKGNCVWESFVSLQGIGTFFFCKRAENSLQAGRLKKGNLLTQEADESRRF